MVFIDATGEKYEPTRWLTFNDVLIQPQRSPFKSRNDKAITLKTDLTFSCPLKIPIISANMDSVTDARMALAMDAQGGLGILHRFYPSLEQYAKEIEQVHEVSNSPVAFSVGCGSDWIKFANNIVEKLQPSLNRSLIICVDVAHGHMDQSLETVKELSKLVNITLIAGNVATPSGALDLAEAGASCIKVGVGSGSVCTTRIVTGHGVPQLSAIMNITKALANEFPSVGIIADGGIKNSGDIVKALAVGADAVMLGNMLSCCYESAGKDTVKDHVSHKIYRGQSSRHFLNDIGKVGVAAEGEMTLIRVKGFLNEILEDILGGIRSGMTYSGASSIPDLRDKAVFVEISQHSWVESMPHALL